MKSPLSRSCLVKFSTLDQAIEYANDSDYGGTNECTKDMKNIRQLVNSSVAKSMLTVVMVSSIEVFTMATSLVEPEVRMASMASSNIWRRKLST